jgi:hypothetical protein
MLGCTTPLRTKARYASENQIVRPMDVNPYGVIHPGVGSVRRPAIRAVADPRSDSLAVVIPLATFVDTCLGFTRRSPDAPHRT